MVRDNGSSSLRLDILGPGTLSFQWGASSEGNPGYSGPGDDIYDALQLYINGSAASQANDFVFISGTAGGLTARQVTLAAGPNRVEWRYSKDPYGTEGEDLGFLHSLDWQPDPAAPYPVYGAFEYPGTPWHGSEWFGVYYTGFWPWVAHVELGWMYFAGTPDGRLYGYSTLALIGNFYTTPSMYPFLYLLDSATWMYHYKGTGAYGKGAWFWNANTNTYVQAP